MNTLLLEPRKTDPFVVLEATGELDLQTQDDFERVVSHFLGSSAVAVDLSGLEFLAISALRSLMVCHRFAGSADQELVYAGPSRQTRRLLQVSGLDTVLPVVESLDQVVDRSAAFNRLPDQALGDLTKLHVG